MGKIDIFYKTYKRDFHLIYISLATLVRNVHGYENLVILVPEHEKHDFDTRLVPKGAHIHYVDETGKNGYLFQQVCKLNAYKYCHSEYILFADSDLIWDKELHLQDLLVDGKPEILYTDFDQLPDAIIWKECTEKFMKGPVKWETMRRLPLLYHRSTLVAISEYAPNLEDEIYRQGRFSEFNAIGSYAQKNESDKYRFVNTDDWQYVPPHGIQFWSHADKDGDLLHVKEYVRFLEAIMAAYGVPIPQK